MKQKIFDGMQSWCVCFKIPDFNSNGDKDAVNEVDGQQEFMVVPNDVDLPFN